MSFYSSAILGTPRNLLGLTRTNRPVIKSDDIWVPLATNAVNPITRLGSLSVQITEDRNFLAYAPETGDKASCVSVYSNETKNDFAFGNFKLMPTQAAFAKKMGNMSEHYGVTLVYLHVPKSTEMHASTIEEAIFWPDAFNADVKLVGIPPVKFFQGISKSDVQKLYFESHHLNANGQKFLTAIITPALINLYETQTKH